MFWLKIEEQRIHSAASLPYVVFYVFFFWQLSVRVISGSVSHFNRHLAEVVIGLPEAVETETAASELWQDIAKVEGRKQ
jgi:hypothetical protein